MTDETNDPVAAPDGVDWANPCARYEALNKAYFQLLSGAQEAQIETRNLDVSERVVFARGDINALRNELRIAEGLCLASKGVRNRNRRYAMGATYRRSYYPSHYDPTDPRV